MSLRTTVKPVYSSRRADQQSGWEGNTLVVDTTNFTNQTPFNGSSENLHVVERFTRTSAETMLYEFTVDDPSTWVKPWTAQLVMGPALGLIYEFACHEGNYGLRNTSAGLARKRSVRLNRPLKALRSEACRRQAEFMNAP